MGVAEIGPDEAMTLTCAGIVGTAELALELERLGLSDEDDSLLDAARLRPVLLDAVQAAREGAAGD